MKWLEFNTCYPHHEAFSVLKQRVCVQWQCCVTLQVVMGDDYECASDLGKLKCYFFFIFFVCSSEGDFRMVIGEDKSKVANIVKDNIQHFRILYSNILRDCPQVVYKPHQGKLEVWYCKQAPEEYTLSFSISDIWATQLSLDIGYFYRVSAE